jgi:hypothetical protein
MLDGDNIRAWMGDSGQQVIQNGCSVSVKHNSVAEEEEKHGHEAEGCPARTSSCRLASRMPSNIIRKNGLHVRIHVRRPRSAPMRDRGHIFHRRCLPGPLAGPPCPS